jgi:hypothetical protein
LGADILQLERRGRSYFVSVAKLGQPFWSIEVPDIDFPEELMVGLFVCSHNPNVIEQGTFIPVDRRPGQFACWANSDWLSPNASRSPLSRTAIFTA